MQRIVALAKWEFRRAAEESARKRAEQEAEYHRTHKKREIRPLIPTNQALADTTGTQHAGHTLPFKPAENAAPPQVSMPQPEPVCGLGALDKEPGNLKPGKGNDEQCKQMDNKLDPLPVSSDVRIDSLEAIMLPSSHSYP